MCRNACHNKHGDPVCLRHGVSAVAGRALTQSRLSYLSADTDGNTGRRRTTRTFCLRELHAESFASCSSTGDRSVAVTHQDFQCQFLKSVVSRKVLSRLRFRVRFNVPCLEMANRSRLRSTPLRVPGPDLRHVFCSVIHLKRYM